MAKVFGIGNSGARSIWFVGVFLCVGSIAHGIGPFHVTDLGVSPTAGAGANEPAAINAFGQIVGSRFVDGHPQAFLWQPTTSNSTFGKIVDLIDPSVAKFPTEANAINDVGQIVGRLGEPNHGSRPFLWQPSTPNAVVGSLADLGDLPGGLDDFGVANDINSMGQVVGTSWSAAGEHAFLWQPTSANSAVGQLVDLGDLPGGRNLSEGHAINERGNISGTSISGSGFLRTFVWRPFDPNGTVGSLVDIGDLSGGVTHSYGAADIDNVGRIIGRWGASDFLWTPTDPNGTWGTFVDLGNLPSANGVFAANAINDFGQMVGMVKARAVFWDPDYGLVYLNERLDPISGDGWELREAVDFNASGQIVGDGYLNGIRHGFLLTPVPEPKTLSLTVFVFAASLCQRSANRIFSPIA